MKNIINRIFNISLSKDKDSNIDIQKNPSYESGEISIKFNGEDGNFIVESNIKDLSDKSAEILSLIILHMSEGNLNYFLSNSIEEWAGEDEEKLIYNQKVALYLENLNEISKNNENLVAVNASKVFNFKDME
jgi:hypothetical protein